MKIDRSLINISWQDLERLKCNRHNIFVRVNTKAKCTSIGVNQTTLSGVNCQYPLFSSSIKSYKSRISRSNSRQKLTIHLLSFSHLFQLGFAIPKKERQQRNCEDTLALLLEAFYQTQQKKCSQEVIIKFPRHFMMSISGLESRFFECLLRCLMQYSLFFRV